MGSDLRDLGGEMDQTSRPVKVRRYTPSIHARASFHAAAVKIFGIFTEIHAQDPRMTTSCCMGVLHSGEVKSPAHVRRTFYGVIRLGKEVVKAG
jgi:hypothetical protein